MNANMRKFQKINAYENEQLFENKLSNENKEVITIEPEDTLVITEKLDGSNASVEVLDGEVKSYSHKGELDADKKLNGFYGFVNDNADYLKHIGDNYIVFGEWLTKHRVQYKDEYYHKWYLFDVYDKASHKYLGYHEAEKLYKDVLYGVDGIEMAPLLEDNVTGIGFNDLPKIQAKYSDKSNYSASGNMEGIVVTDLSKTVPTSQTTTGPLRIKLVNATFKESKHVKEHSESISLTEWINNNVTLARVSKKVLEGQDEGELPSELSFDWMRNGNTNKVATEVLLDAIEESPELPAEIKQLIRVSRAQARKYVALKVKNMI
ncbi:RNA ligase [Lactobacillus phage Iacchus]|uniref:Putative ligase n=2 Tax=Harbinvirus TaxID=2732970 RepID=A0A3Q8I011_9CAUD|nr:RNA ligase [Lactobacillus phage Iacchus]YP_009814537.1 RNA ligase [Lactobacillus phage Bromius]AYH92040.1 putative ligase [Lactobacillus phage Iacchus]AYH92212.1 putative ligase [Lactobacillus phage Dionysus]AYH92386.1 putative ligase [Lactobacillus phage Bromius]